MKRFGCLALPVLVTLAILWAAASAVAQQPAASDGDRSLLFSMEEVAMIRKAQADQAAGGGSLEAADSASALHLPVLRNVFVSAVVDFGHGQWVAWINDSRITPDHPSSEFQVLSVKENEVEIALPSEQGVRFRLRPNQTLLVHNHQIVEGIWR